MLITAGQAVVDFIGGVGSTVLSGIATGGTVVGDVFMKLLGA